MQNYAIVFVANGYILLVWLPTQMMPNWYNLFVQDPLEMQTSRNECTNDFWHIIEIWEWICSAALRFLIITGIHISCAWHNSLAVMSYTKFYCGEREKKSSSNLNFDSKYGSGIGVCIPCKTEATLKMRPRFVIVYNPSCPQWRLSTLLALCEVNHKPPTESP